MRKFMRNLLNAPPRVDVHEEWDRVVRKTVARFARGNISAQKGRILTEEGKAREHERAAKIARNWKRRAKRAA
jgi:hypothetical protein